MFAFLYVQMISWHPCWQCSQAKLVAEQDMTTHPVLFKYHLEQYYILIYYMRKYLRMKEDQARSKSLFPETSLCWQNLVLVLTAVRCLTHSSKGLGVRSGLKHVRKGGCGKTLALPAVCEITQWFSLVSKWAVCSFTVASHLILGIKFYTAYTAFYTSAFCKHLHFSRIHLTGECSYSVKVYVCMCVTCLGRGSAKGP